MRRHYHPTPARRKTLLTNVLIFKLAITVGIALAYFLPSHLAWLSGLSANLLWLWRD